MNIDEEICPNCLGYIYYCDDCDDYYCLCNGDCEHLDANDVRFFNLPNKDNRHLA